MAKTKCCCNNNPCDCWLVRDARNGNETGPYSEADAKAQAQQLSEFVAKNTLPVLFALAKQPGGKITGPFYAHKVG
jgi:hypothetical protein